MAFFLPYLLTDIEQLMCRRNYILRIDIICVFFPFILDFNGRTSRGHTGSR